jgi:imidazolonepropionase-like amidohydrolase
MQILPRRSNFALILALLLLTSAFRAQAQSTVTPAPLTLIKAARLLDPRTGNVLAPAAVLIEGAKIKQVGSPSSITIPAGAKATTKIIDLGSATLLPGLIDAQARETGFIL